jgi:hypothetical protein
MLGRSLVFGLVRVYGWPWTGMQIWRWARLGMDSKVSCNGAFCHFLGALSSEQGTAKRRPLHLCAALWRLRRFTSSSQEVELDLCASWCGSTEMIQVS